MTQGEYKVLQGKNIDSALKTGKELLQVSASLHKVCDTADTDAARGNGAKNYSQDALMYFDFNDAVTDISGMPGDVNVFRQQLIDIKVANDRMLLESGYVRAIDEAVANFFESHDLRDVKIIDEAVLAAVRDALQMLEEMKKAL